MFTRRNLIKAAGAGLALTGSGLELGSALAARTGIDLTAALPEGARSNAVIDWLLGKKPLIKLSYRPPNYETPIEYFRTAITPNDAFFVRYHLSNIPEVDVKTWKIVVGGEGANGQAEFTLDDLKRLPAAELVAVNLCSGSRRGLFQPHVPGVQWSNGAMGCARWKGARLKDLLDKVGLKKEAIEIVFDGADSGVTDKTPESAPSKTISIASFLRPTLSRRSLSRAPFQRAQPMAPLLHCTPGTWGWNRPRRLPEQRFTATSSAAGNRLRSSSVNSAWPLAPSPPTTIFQVLTSTSGMFERW